MTGLRGAAHGTGSGAGGVPARGDRPGRGFATKVSKKRVTSRKRARAGG